MILNMHVQLSLCVWPPSEGPQLQTQLLQVPKEAYLLSMAIQVCFREVLTSDPFRALNYVCFLNPVMHLSSLENIEFSLQWQPSDLCTDVGIEHSAALLGLQQSPKRAQEDCASWALASLHWAERALKRTCLLAWTGEANPSVGISLALPAEPLFQIQGWNFEYDESGLFSSRYLFSQMGSDKYITCLYKNVWKV